MDNQVVNRKAVDSLYNKIMDLLRTESKKHDYNSSLVFAVVGMCFGQIINNLALFYEAQGRSGRDFIDEVLDPLKKVCISNLEIDLKEMRAAKR